MESILQTTIEMQNNIAQIQEKCFKSILQEEKEADTSPFSPLLFYFEALQSWYMRDFGCSLV